MSTFSVDDAQNKLQQLINEVTQSHQPIRITGKNSSAILLAEKDWSAIQETLYLLSVPGMRESIQEGLATEIADCSEELDW